MGRAWLALLVFALGIGGCLRLDLQQEYPERRSFALGTERSRLPAPADGPILRLPPLRILAPFDGRSFIYRYDPVRFEADYYNQFISPPEQLLRAEMQRWLGAAGLFSRVLGTGGNQQGTGLLLEGTITELYGDYRLRIEPLAVMAIDLALHDSESSALLWRRDYRCEWPLEEPTAAALARAWRQGLALILLRLEEDLARTLATAEQNKKD
jgi:hypothetical protein